MGVPRGRSPSGKFRMCPNRVHPVQNGMPFCETCLSSPPRLQQFLRAWMWRKQPLKERCFFRIRPEKIFRNLQGDDSGFVIFRRGWMSRKQCSVLEDCFLLVHCRRKITRLQSSRPAPAIFTRNINCNSHKNTGYTCLTHHCFVLQFVKHKYHFISAV